jgi:hypothetical protein
MTGAFSSRAAPSPSIDCCLIQLPMPPLKTAGFANLERRHLLDYTSRQIPRDLHVVGELLYLEDFLL